MWDGWRQCRYRTPSPVPRTPALTGHPRDSAHRRSCAALPQYEVGKRQGSSGIHRLDAAQHFTRFHVSRRSEVIELMNDESKGQKFIDQPRGGAACIANTIRPEFHEDGLKVELFQAVLHAHEDLRLIALYIDLDEIDAVHG